MDKGKINEYKLIESLNNKQIADIIYYGDNNYGIWATKIGVET